MGCLGADPLNFLVRGHLVPPYVPFQFGVMAPPLVLILSPIAPSFKKELLGIAFRRAALRHSAPSRGLLIDAAIVVVAPVVAVAGSGSGCGSSARIVVVVVAAVADAANAADSTIIIIIIIVLITSIIIIAIIKIMIIIAGGGRGGV